MRRGSRRKRRTSLCMRCCCALTRRRAVSCLRSRGGCACGFRSLCSRSVRVSPAGLALQVVARWLHFAGYALGFGTLAFGLVVLRPLGISERGSAERRMRWLVSGGIALLLVAAAVTLVAQVVSLGAGSPFAP